MTLMSRDLANATVGVMFDLPFNFSRMVFDGLVSNLRKKVDQRFLQYPRFLQIIINVELQNPGQLGDVLNLQDPNTFQKD